MAVVADPRIGTKPKPLVLLAPYNNKKKNHTDVSLLLVVMLINYTSKSVQIQFNVRKRIYVMLCIMQ